MPDVMHLLSCCLQHKGALSPQWADGVELTKLYPYNVNVRAENEKRLQSLPGALETFTAEDSLKTRAGISSRLEALGVEKKLQLKIGAQVIFFFLLECLRSPLESAEGGCFGVSLTVSLSGHVFEELGRCSGAGQWSSRCRHCNGVKRYVRRRQALA